MKTSRLVVSFALPGLILGSAACGTKTDLKQQTNRSTTSTVAVTLQEYAVLPAQASAPAGTVTFAVENKGPKHNHELVVVRTDLAPESLPTKADGSVDETGAGIAQALGEIEELAPNKTESKAFELQAGKYVLFCNLVEAHDGMADMPMVHYKLGMRTAFTVT